MPRCPECGLAFDAAAWQRGLAWARVPTGLDRCDLWQPHQVLWHSLVALRRGALRPRRAWPLLDLDGPLAPAGLMLLCGSLWAYAPLVVLIAVATCVQTGVSPYAALLSAVLFWLPRVWVVATLSAVALLGFVGAVLVPAERAGALRCWARLAGYWIPAASLYVVFALAVLLLLPPMGGWLALRALAPTAPVVLGMLVFERATRRWRQIGRAVPLRWRAWLLLPAFAVPAVAIEVAHAWLPSSLEPPVWVYF